MKAPMAKGWNLPKSRGNPNGYSNNAADFANLKGYNYGLFHGASNTLALDLDDFIQAKCVFLDVAGVSIKDWFINPGRLEIKSPKPNRGKLIFKLPDDFVGIGLRQLKLEGKVVFELRSGNCQDVIYGQHPEGGSYQLIGNPAVIPEAPAILMDMMQNWDIWKPCFDPALGNATETPKIVPRKSQQGAHLKGRRDPIHEFNHITNVQSILLANGYKQVGRDRFIRPGSESKAPGAVIMRNCKDGVERVYSHGGDVLNDGFAHDAFDCFCLLECGGDSNKALAWNPEITEHNQKMFKEASSHKSHPKVETFYADSEPKPRPLFPLISATELLANPIKIVWLLSNIIEQYSLNLLFGEPGAGKSLFALEWAFCITLGLQWNGCKTLKADVVIVAGEGYSGYQRRLRALEIKHQQKAAPNLYISQRPAQFLDDFNIRWLADSIRSICANPGLIIIDTLHRNMDGDENSSQDIGKFISNIDQHLKPIGAAVLVVHHSGHQAKERSRGSSSIRAAMDGEFSATRNECNIVLACHKSKDFEAFKPKQFSLKVVELDWLDEEDEPMTSVCLEFQGEAKKIVNKRSLSARDDAILTSLNESIVGHGIEPTEEIKSKFSGFNTFSSDWQKIVHIDHWREQAYKGITVNSDTENGKAGAKKKAFDRCRNKLFNEGYTVEYGDYVWRIFKT